MSKAFDFDGEGAPQPSSDSFMEPRTIPKNWDVSAFESQETSSRDDSAGQREESETSPKTDNYEGEGPAAAFDPFPQPRTVPGQWDVSDLV
jgi:hypothetical protein